MRMTRAALRAQESEDALKTELDSHLKKQAVPDTTDIDILIREDSDRELSSDDKISHEQSPERKALRDITEENYPTTAENEAEPPEDLVTKKEGPKKSKKGKGKGGKKKAAKSKEPVDPEDETNSVVHDEESTNEVHETAVETFSIVAGHPHEDVFVEQDKATGTDQPDIHDPCISELARDDTGPSVHSASPGPDYVEARPPTPERTIETATKTPKFNPEIHVTAETSLEQSRDGTEDSFVDSIRTRSPTKMATSQSQDADLLTGSTPTRTPSRAWSSPRVEDSVAALDDLEDALEKYSDDLTALDSMKLESPTKKRKSAILTPTKLVEKTKTPVRSASRPVSFVQPKMTPKPAGSSVDRTTPRSTVKDRVKAIESRPALQSHRRGASLVVAKKDASTAAKTAVRAKHVPSKSITSIGTKQDMSFSSSPAKKQPVYMHKRVTSGPLVTSKPGFVPAKSTKPATKSAFVLPGEAIAAKLKAQREERQKREEEAAEQKKQELKSKPIPVRTARPSVMPRENKASQARSNAVSKSGAEDKENVAPARTATARPSSMVVKPKTDLTRANSSARRTTTAAPSATSAPSSKKATATNRPTVASTRVMSTAAVKSTTANSTMANRAVPKGKEITSRHRESMDDLQREKRSKEEAARKARAEAAERGRQASREWAEKQKKRLAADKAIKLKLDSPVTAAPVQGAITA